MKTVVFNVHNSAIHRGGESVALRIGYLISDYVVSIGTTGFEILFSTWFNPPKLEQKVEWMEKFYANRGEEMQLKAANVKETMKALRKIKHLDKEGIVTLKKFEKAVDVLFQMAKAEALEEKKETGLPQLESLYTGEVFGGYASSLNTPEHPEENAYAVSQLLSLDLPDLEEGMSLFLLTHEFFLFQENKNQKWFSVGSSEAKATDNMYFEKCLTFPQVNILNAVELKTLRQQFEPLSIPFRKAVDRWMELCYNNVESKETLAHFRQQVQTNAAPLNNLIKQNEVLNHYQRLFNQAGNTNVWLGEVPVKYIWEFYREGKAIEDESWEKLMQIYETRNLNGKRWPVIVIEIPEAKDVAKEMAQTQHEIKAVKKSISVD